jgi:uncharacterized protein with FMN-binding domain
MKKLIKIGLVVVLILGLLAIGGTLAVRSIEERMAGLLETEVVDPEFSAIPDGTYEGTCDAFAVKVVVRVRIEAGLIDEVVLLEHRNGQGASGEAIVDDILESQSLEIDTIAGATYSSKAILLAVADALSKAPSAE